MLGMLIIAVMGLYIARQRKQIKQLRAMLDSCLDDLETAPKGFRWFEPETPKPAIPKPKRRKQKIKDMDADLDGIPINDV